MPEDQLPKPEHPLAESGQDVAKTDYASLFESAQPQDPQNEASQPTETASWTSPEDLYKSPEVLDRATYNERNRNPHEGEAQYQKRTVVADELPLDALRFASAPEAPEMHVWEKPGLNLQEQLNNRQGPFMEFGGPTYDDFTVLEGVKFPQKVLVSNIDPGLTMGSGENRRVVGRVDAQMDVTNMHLRNESLGAILAAALPATVRDGALDEAMRVLEPGGLLFWQSGDLEDAKIAQDKEFITAKAVLAAEPESQAYQTSNPDTGEAVAVYGSASYVLMKP